MAAAEEPDPIRSVLVRPREPVDVIELKNAGLGAPAALLIGVRTAPAVAFEDLSLDRIRNVARSRLAVSFAAARSRLADLTEPLLLDLLDEQVQRLFDDGAHVSIREAVPEQLLGLTELVATRAASGELKLEGLLGERCNDGAATIATRRRSARRRELGSRRRSGLQAGQSARAGRSDNR